MNRIPLAAVPSQTFTITVGGQSCEISLRQNGANMYFDLRVNGQNIVLSRIVRNKQLLLLDVRYKGFIGDFIFNDMLGDTQPVYTGLNTRYVLFYRAPGDVLA